MHSPEMLLREHFAEVSCQRNRSDVQSRAVLRAEFRKWLSSPSPLDNNDTASTHPAAVTSAEQQEEHPVQIVKSVLTEARSLPAFPSDWLLGMSQIVETVTVDAIQSTLSWVAELQSIPRIQKGHSFGKTGMNETLSVVEDATQST